MATATAASVLDEAAEAAKVLSAQRNGGCAYAVVSRAYTPLMGDTAILQHFAASAAFARTVVEVLNAPTRPWDVILQSRPDIVFSAAVDVAKIRHLFRSAHLASQSASTSSSSSSRSTRQGTASTAAAATSRGFVLLIRHSDHDYLGWNDPSEIAWFVSRNAYERLCPDGVGCLGARRALDLKTATREHSGGSCGHPYVSLFIHASPWTRVDAFFVPVGWRVQLLRLNGDMTRGFNGREQLLGGGGSDSSGDGTSSSSPSSSSGATLLPTRYDLTAGLRCAVGYTPTYDGHSSFSAGLRNATTSGSACRRDAAPVVRTRWGLANLTTGFSYGARYYICNEPLALADVVRRAAGE